ncbi:glucosamine-6-phosphate deaminase [Bacillus cihuensis]|uniref:glucosamine-6-phosphate deaminase n=1 Tax=Bacillus cihuensis TaxID=1208599 RepID=UPI0003FCA34D|nr:glucosamine-6-phosphate deaminase [Bacillus cihuensis]
MKIFVGKDYNEMSQIAANHVLGYMYQPSRVNLAITAGSTPKRIYELLIPHVKEKPHFENVHYYNFDEIPFKEESGFGVTMRNLKKMYFDPAGISTDHIHVLDETNYQTHDDRLAKDGGLDMIIIGIGADGHYCGNLPGTTTFNDITSAVATDVSENMPEIIRGEVGGDMNKVPDFYVTMGPKSVMHARHIILIANGEHKADIIQKALFGPVDANVPASILQMHPNLTVILDKDAASKIR